MYFIVRDKDVFWPNGGHGKYNATLVQDKTAGYVGNRQTFYNWRRRHNKNDHVPNDSLTHILFRQVEEPGLDYCICICYFHRNNCQHSPGSTIPL